MLHNLCSFGTNLHKNIWRGTLRASTHQNSLLFQSPVLLCFMAHRKLCFSATQCKTLVPYRLERAVVKMDTLKLCPPMAHSNSALSSQWWWSPPWRTKREMWKPVELWTPPSPPVTSQDEEGPGFYSLLGQVKSCNEQFLVLSTAAGSGIYIFVMPRKKRKTLKCSFKKTGVCPDWKQWKRHEQTLSLLSYSISMFNEILYCRFPFNPFYLLKFTEAIWNVTLEGRWLQSCKPGY